MTQDTMLRAAVVGAGLLGIDLAHRIIASDAMTSPLVVGRASSTTGLRTAARMGCATSTGGVQAVIDAGADIVFDASNAAAHAAHWADLASSGVVLVDLTPSSAGAMVVPTVNGHVAESGRHLSLISCGGQAVLPVLDAVTRQCRSGPPEYVEVITTAASASVGRAARLDLDEYIATTGHAVAKLTHAAQVKVLANISPARPAPAFRAEVAVVAGGIDPEPLRAGVEDAAAAVRTFAPGYQVVSCTVDGDLVRVSVTVTACGGRQLPAFAGNVEIINAATVLLAERHARARKA